MEAKGILAIVFRKNICNQNPGTRKYGVIGNKIFINVYIKVDQTTRKEQILPKR